MRYFLILALGMGWGMFVPAGWCLSLEEQAFIYHQGVRNYERNWNRWQEAGEPWERYSVRMAADYAYALVSAEQFFSRQDVSAKISPSPLPMERITPLLELLQTMQDRNPDSPTYGNFRWYWGQEGVQDRNAVEFVAGRLIFCKQHEKVLPESARKMLETILLPAAEALQKHTVTSDYTNIAILNSSNLILLGELCGRDDWYQEGTRRLHRFIAHTWKNGVSEFSTPVYYALNLETLATLARGTKNSAIRQKAETLLEYFTAEIACRWFFPAHRLSGAYSRTYHYADSDPYLLYVLQCWGWEPLPPQTANITMIGILNGSYFPPPPTPAPMPRLIQQSIGGEQGSLTTFLTPKFAMGSAFLTEGYRKDDVLFAVDLPNRPRCYFFPDGCENPYGNQRFLASNQHLRAYHLQPSRFLVRQEKPWLVSLEVEYSLTKEDWKEENRTRLQSHFLFPIPDAFWLNGKKISLEELEKNHSLRHVVLQYDQIFLHLWLEGIYPENRSTPVFCKADSPDERSMRLTIDHGLLQEKKERCGIRKLIFLMSDQLEDDWNVTPNSWKTYETVDFTHQGRKLLENGIPELAPLAAMPIPVQKIDLQVGESQIWQAEDGKFCPLFQENHFLWVNHEVEYGLNVLHPGEYRLKALVWAENDKQNSFWFRLTSEQPFSVASFPPCRNWEWREVSLPEKAPLFFHGTHLLEIRPREYNLRVKALQIERVR